MHRQHITCARSDWALVQVEVAAAGCQPVQAKLDRLRRDSLSPAEANPERYPSLGRGRGQDTYGDPSLVLYALHALRSMVHARSPLRGAQYDAPGGAALHAAHPTWEWSLLSTWPNKVPRQGGDTQ